ncbi:DUF3107 domain-containing protein [Micrococcales bacterium 31B]|nr:DUF3107 domain-containing protein [Micrococcales bacterium 31B]
MEIRIGVQNSARELRLESDQTADEVHSLVDAALKDAKPLVLKDAKGRSVLVPSSTLAYVEIAAEEPRRVGFIG